jgi:hypothetical protein
MDTDPQVEQASPSEPRQSRKEIARRRARTLKVGAAVAASGAFVAVATAAYEAHPGGGGALAGDGSLTVPAELAELLTHSNDFGEGGSIAPLQSDGSSTPRTTTHTS